MNKQLEALLNSIVSHPNCHHEDNSCTECERIEELECELKQVLKYLQKILRKK